ncbi:MAG: DUF1638 domain-containing protein [Nitrospinae bacterium]|nr:DUF1638 domain-containing protein [Nitrospinota bacterium]MBF0633154.1 DUF1638 domain-containing protein [Nitrospinota bacterium]
MRDRTAVLMCATFQRELERILGSEGMDTVDALPMPTKCHKPSGNHSSIHSDCINKAKQKYGAIHIFRSGCGFGEEDRLPNDDRCFLHTERLCFYMLAERDIVDSLLLDGAYLLSSGWLSRWKFYMADWGMEREMAIEFFAESARKLVLLDTMVDKDSQRHLDELADFVRLPSDSVPVGLDFFRDYIRARLV